MNTTLVEELLTDFTLSGREKELTFKRKHVLQLIDLIKPLREERVQLANTLDRYSNKVDRLQEIVDESDNAPLKYREFKWMR